MRFKIMFGLTFLIVLTLLFYPNNQYLGKYKDTITIDYRDFKLSNDCEWNYELSNDNIKLLSKDENIWKYKYIKNGKTTLNYYCSDDKGKNIYKITYELKVKNNYIYWLKGDGKGMLDFPNLY